MPMIKTIDTDHELQFLKILESLRNSPYGFNSTSQIVKAMIALEEMMERQYQEVLQEATSEKVEDALENIESIWKNRLFQVQTIIHERRPKVDEKRKEFAGGIVTYTWLGSGVFIFWANENATILSWQAVVYFVLGTFVAAVVLGLVLYAAGNSISKMLETRFLFQLTCRFTRRTSAKRGYGNFSRSLTFLGWFLIVFIVVITYQVADFVISDILFPKS